MDVQRMLELRKMLEQRVAQLQEELRLYTALMEVLDQAIGARSFSTAAEAARAERAEGGERPEGVEEVRGRNGEVYATVEVYRDRLRIRFRRPVRVDGLFKRFFLDKFLQKFRDEDAREGAPQLRYELEGGEEEAEGLQIYNYRTEERRREILRVLRWTLDKVYGERG